MEDGLERLGLENARRLDVSVAFPFEKIQLRHRGFLLLLLTRNELRSQLAGW